MMDEIYKIQNGVGDGEGDGEGEGRSDGGTTAGFGLSDDECK